MRSLLPAMAGEKPLGANRAGAGGLRASMERALHFRRAQHQVFPETVLRGACWDIMLSCMAGELAGRPVCVKQIRTQLRESQTSVLRRIDELERSGLVQRRRDEMDGRRTLLRLTPEGDDAMSRFFSALDDSAG
ncbi:MarR family winged helix-turn-helix transcriptional regulator [Rhizorhabdus dicambivorans]|uniref:MarR family winged helix-turn-helix transcriptional regulator n=1 Tax=Rhizorhabdus dicambivorans TaxID=1850238 RepID=UPI001596FFB7|nr:winged helix DNA-binding protein [Rhizorhabdus dicambivorans]